VLAETERLPVFPGVAGLPMRGPAMLSKVAASLDRLSGGRFDLGLGSSRFGRCFGLGRYGGFVTLDRFGVTGSIRVGDGSSVVAGTGVGQRRRRLLVLLDVFWLVLGRRILGHVFSSAPGRVVSTRPREGLRSCAWQSLLRTCCGLAPGGPRSGPTRCLAE
jgi:hypothetical protein